MHSIVVSSIVVAGASFIGWVGSNSRTSVWQTAALGGGWGLLVGIVDMLTRN